MDETRPLPGDPANPSNPSNTQNARSGTATRSGPELTLLCVDDEPNTLAALRRVLRLSGCQVLAATSGAQGLEILDRTPVDLVVSDLRMPGMDGVLFLEQVRARWPQTIRILLSGAAELSAAVAAINRTRIFRYLSKPWDDAELLNTVNQGLELIVLHREKARLQTLAVRQNLELRALNEDLEQRVLERTEDLAQANKRLTQGYLTTIKVFSNLLELRATRLRGHGRRVAQLARAVAKTMALSEQAVQDVFVAGLLHDIGHIGLPEALLCKPVAQLDAQELALYQRHPQLGEQSLMALEDLQSVAWLVHAHHERYDGLGYPEGKAGLEIPLGARILAVVDAYDELMDGHLGGTPSTADEARALLHQGRKTQFDPEVLEIFTQVMKLERRKEASAQIVGTPGLAPDMILASDLISGEGIILLVAGQRLTVPLIRRIRQYEQRAKQPFRVHIQRFLDER
jgi:response regulator RpfG family c-di-GMP phosphodiesterase